MTALAVLQETKRMGIRLEAVGEILRVRAPKGTLTAEIQHRLKQNKSSLLSLLRPTGEPELYGLTLGDLEEIAGADWPEVRDDPKQLQAFAHMVATRRLRERGEVPQHYTTITVCAGCGPVWLWPGAPDRVMACPWCFNRIAGRPIPRPTNQPTSNT